MNFYENLLHFTMNPLQADIVLRAAGVTKEEIEEIRNGKTPDCTITDIIARRLGIGTLDLDPNAVLPKKAYLAGPITSNVNFMVQFQQNQTFLETLGLDVINPAELTARLPKSHLKRKNFLDLGSVLIHMADFIVLMPGWKQSSGCRMERGIAEAYGLPVIELSELQLIAKEEAVQRIEDLFDKQV